MIQPTNGRVVWYWPAGPKPPQPWAALVTFVHSDRCVNLRVFTPSGAAWGASAITLYQGEPGEECPTDDFCEWMPYQKGQAAKTEALEKQVTAAAERPEQKEWTAPELKKAAIEDLTAHIGHLREDDPS